MSVHLRNFAAGAALAAAALVSAPAAAAPVSLRSFAAEQMRVEAMGYRMGVASAGLCRDREMLSGLLLHDLSQYDPGVRPAVARAFSLTSGVGIIQIVPQSAAERAGLRVDDEILAIGGASIEDPRAATGQRRSYARVQRTKDLLESSLQNGPAVLTVRRRGSIVRVSLAGEAGCGGQVSLIDSRESNAWSDGKHVVVTTAIAQLAKTDDEVAFVVAHEMAHNILGHSRSSSPRLFGLSLGIAGARRSELSADSLAVELMRDGGYKVGAGVAFLQTASRRFWWSLSLDHPGFGRRIRAVNAAIAALPATPVSREPPAIPRVTVAAMEYKAVPLPVVAATSGEHRVELAQAQGARPAIAYFRSPRTNCDR